ncbi:SPOR domain-containing protein [Paenibacillus glucanolyticus]|uniref:SPOR domain-containing protein n=1 Tax=Paenibacillus glucanolyticus TaxID=59843 RepID=UPI0034CECB73
MNKARMTIRFDHDPPKDRSKEPLHEERDLSQRVSLGHKYQVYDPNLSKQDHLRIVPPLQEEEDGHAFDVNDQDWRQSRNNRTKGRLAEERRRLDHSNSWYQSDTPEYTDTYPELDEDLHHPHEHDYSGGRDGGTNNSNWDLGPESGLYDSPADDYGYYRSRKPTSFWKMAVSVSAAVITGLLFGYMVLSMFNGGSAGEDTVSEQIEGNDVVNQTPTDPSEGTVTPLSSDLPQTALQFPGQAFYMLQYGVFSTPERAEQAKGELLQSGIAAGGDLDEENRVYAGISPDREQAKLLSNQLKAEGVELYVREISLPQLESASFSGEEQTLTDYFTISGKLVSELSKLSASLLGMQEAGAVAADHMNTITNLHQQWIQSVQQLSAGLGPETGAVLPAMQQSMNSSITALSEYNKNQSKGHLWEIQTGMMNYVMGQKKLLDGL